VLACAKPNPGFPGGKKEKGGGIGAPCSFTRGLRSRRKKEKTPNPLAPEGERRKEEKDNWPPTALLNSSARRIAKPY